jgi:hypothetical protein
MTPWRRNDAVSPSISNGSSIRRGAAALGLALLALTPAPSLAAGVECSVNVLTAYQTAVKRGWRFSCDGVAGIQGNFVTYPPNGIGCTYKTGMLVPPPAPLTGNSSLLLFQGQSATQLKNGWSIKLFELEGGQYKPMGTSDTLVAAWITLGAPNRTYNYKLTKLVLQKLIGSCTNVIGEAF